MAMKIIVGEYTASGDGKSACSIRSVTGKGGHSSHERGRHLFASAKSGVPRGLRSVPATIPRGNNTLARYDDDRLEPVR